MGIPDHLTCLFFSNVVDIDSFCDWYLVHELCGNAEPNHPKSCFFHMRDRKMYAGPVWDFDWHTFQVDSYGWCVPHCLWFDKLLANASFKARLKERWSVLKPKFETLPEYIDAQALLIRRAEPSNWAMWPCYPNPLAGDYGMINNDEDLSFDGAVDKMKQAVTKRIVVLDKLIQAL